MRVALLGLGLIGGSVARALREAPDAGAWHVAAWTPSGDGPKRAVADGVVAVAAQDPATALDGAELVVLAGPPSACLDWLDRLAGRDREQLAPAAVVTDVASTKGALVERARRLGIRYVGGHPMAGRETTGYDAADATLFRDRPWVVVPADPADVPAILTVETLAAACGARPIRLDAAAHDAAVAGISHLPLVLAASLVEAVAGTGDPREGWATARLLAASGWRDMTRLARGDATMGAGIAATNAHALAARLRAVRDVVDGWLAELERPGGPDEAVLEARLQAVRDRLAAGG